MKKLAYTPIRDAAAAMAAAVSNMVEKLFVTRNAMAPGAIRTAIANMMPTAFKAATIVKESIVSRPY